MHSIYLIANKNIMAKIQYVLVVVLCLGTDFGSGESAPFQPVVKTAYFMLRKSKTLLSGSSHSVSHQSECATACKLASSCKGFSFRHHSQNGQRNCRLSNKGSRLSDNTDANNDWEYFEMLPDLDGDTHFCNRFESYPGWKFGIPGFSFSALGIVSQNKPATQSSTSAGGYATRAVDGNRDSRFRGRSCTHTNRMDSPWWRVDLGGRYYVAAVRITNRSDCCYERFKNAQIRIGMSLENNGNSNPLCTDTIPSLGKGETKEFCCNLSIAYGRFVNVALQGLGVLAMCEVEAVGVRVEL